MSHEPIRTKVTEIKLAQPKVKKEGAFLRQTLDDSHVKRQRGEDAAARSFPKSKE